MGNWIAFNMSSSGHILCVVYFFVLKKITSIFTSLCLMSDNIRHLLTPVRIEEVKSKVRVCDYVCWIFLCCFNRRKKSPDEQDVVN